MMFFDEWFDETLFGSSLGLLLNYFKSTPEEKNKVKRAYKILKRGFQPGDLLQVINTHSSSFKGFDSVVNIDSYALLIKEEFIPYTFGREPAIKIILTFLINEKVVKFYNIQTYETSNDKGSMRKMFAGYLLGEEPERFFLRLDCVISYFHVIELI